MNRTMSVLLALSMLCGCHAPRPPAPATEVAPQPPVNGDPAPLAAAESGDSAAPASAGPSGLAESAAPSPAPPGPKGPPPPGSEARPPRPKYKQGVVGEVEFRVRTEHPAQLTLDGSIDEWLDGSPVEKASVVVITLEPTRAYVAFDVPVTLGPEAFQLEFPGAQLPDIGVVVRGGGTYEVDCEHESWGMKAEHSAAQRAECQGIVARFTSLQHKQARRFSTRIPLSEMDKARPAATARQCRRTEQRLACEIEYTLRRLPRTSEVDLKSLGVRVVSGGKHAPPETLWLKLPEPVAFEPGLELRRLLLPQTPGWLPESDRYSYQPGEPVSYELATRQQHSSWGMADIAVVVCRPSAVVAEVGRIALRRACDQGILYVDGAPKDSAKLGRVSKYLIRAGRIYAITNTRRYCPDVGADELIFRVDQFSTEGRVGSQSISINERDCRSISAHHNADYSTMTLSCPTRPDVTGGASVLKTKSIDWSPAEARHIVTEGGKEVGR